MSDSEFPPIRPLHEPRRVGPTSALRPRRRGLGDKRVLAGIGAACVLGLLGGFLMKPNLDDQPPAKPTNARTAEIPREPEWLPIIVDRAPPPEPVTPLEPQPQTPPTPAQPPAQSSPHAADRPATKPYVEPKPKETRTPTPHQRARPSFNCRYARSPSERMVCADPNLAAADRRLARAYTQAVDSGVPERVLRRQQDVWLNAREQAASYGPEEVERVYDARIAELRSMSR
ncbi:MAG TPA: lysozyme inhibitor LprI family protein [Caulobacteraceae bacterium]